VSVALHSIGRIDRDAIALIGALRSSELQRTVLEQLSDAARRGHGADPEIDGLLERVERGELLTPPTEPHVTSDEASPRKAGEELGERRSGWLGSG